MIDNISLDYLQKIRDQMWSRKEYGNVGLMIGSGFSRNAEKRSLNVLNFPLWRDLVDQMYKELNPTRFDEHGCHFDTLKIASMYDATFERSNLNRFLLKAIPDEDYFPGKLHKMLLKLPWADVFCTNYDTLLERTLPFIHERKYEIIRKIESIHGSHKPRIVKLHGSFPDIFPFTITEEDFRLYPTKFAPFVNMVQQSLMENIFCLLGFSGEDPNFLKWTGWIRDNFGKNAPPIYLVGLLDIQEPQKKLFEERGVKPIDLAPLYPKDFFHDNDERNSKALEWFFFYLEKGAPFDPMRWPALKQFTVFAEKPVEDICQIPDSHYSKDYGKRYIHLPSYKDDEEKKNSIIKDLRGISERWQIERENYPGWFICPKRSREHIYPWYEKLLMNFVITHVNELPCPENLSLIFELIWRLDKFLIPMDPDWINCMNEILEKCNPFDTANMERNIPKITEYWVDIAFSLLRHARENFEEECFNHWQERLDQISSRKETWKLRLHYEKCIFALYRLDFEQVKNNLTEWPESLEKLHIEIKRIGILIELGDLKAAEKLGEKILYEIRRRQIGNKIDYYLLSLEGWAIFNLHLLNTHKYSKINPKEEPKEYWDRLEQLNLYNCNPFMELESMKLMLKSQEPYLKKSEEVSKGFDPGRYQCTYISDTDYSNYISILPAFVFLRMLEEAGLPFSCPGVNPYPNNPHLNAARWIYGYSNLRAISVLTRSLNKAEIETFFTRILITEMDEKMIQKLFSIFVKAWKQHTVGLKIGSNGTLSPVNQSYQYFEILTEIVSKFFIRLSNSQIDDLFQQSVELYKWLAFSGYNDITKIVRNLFYRLLNAMPNREILRRVSILLSLPIPGEDFQKLHPSEWPDPLDLVRWGNIDKLPEGFDRSNWDRSIELLIRIVKDGESLARKFSLKRLIRIHQIDGLKKTEKKIFFTALWSRVDNNGFPTETGKILKSYLLYLNETDIIEVKYLLKEYLVKKEIHELNTYPASDMIDFLNSILGVTKPLFSSDDKKINYIEWTESEAVQIFRKMSELWKKNNAKLKRKKNTFGFVRQFEQHLRIEVFQLIPQILAKVILPICKDRRDKKFKKDIETLLKEMEEYDFVTNAAKPGLMFFDEGISDSISAEIKKGLESLESNMVDNSIQALYYWMAYSYLDNSFPRVPLALMDELIWIITLRRQPGLNYALSYLGYIVENMPGMLNEFHLENISTTVDYLIEETIPNTVKQGMRTQSNFPIKIEYLTEYRSKLSALAFAMYNYFIEKNKTEAKRIKKWKEILTNDSLPEVWKVWDSI